MSIQADTEAEGRKSMADQLGAVLSDTLINTDDPTLQTNVLLGQILVYLGQIVQQNNTNNAGTKPTAYRKNPTAFPIIDCRPKLPAADNPSKYGL